MAYDRTRWQDHVVERPRTFIEVDNEDGSVTHTPAEGEVLQQGTPQSATNFNKIEDALQHTCVAFDWLSCIAQANARHQAQRIETLEADNAEAMERLRHYTIAHDLMQSITQAQIRSQAARIEALETATGAMIS